MVKFRHSLFCFFILTFKLKGIRIILHYAVNSKKFTFILRHLNVIQQPIVIECRNTKWILTTSNYLHVNQHQIHQTAGPADTMLLRNSYATVKRRRDLKRTTLSSEVNKFDAGKTAFAVDDGSELNKRAHQVIQKPVLYKYSSSV